MPHFIYPMACDLFHQRVRPVLADCWRQRSFVPGRAFCGELLAGLKDVQAAYHGLADSTLIQDVAEGLAFDRRVWRALVGEVLLIAAEDVPLLQISPPALCILLAAENFGKDVARTQFLPIEQVLYGSHDLVFAGGYYRPDFAGYQELDDVARLVDYLQEIDPRLWQPADLRALPELADDEERAEELEFVRQGWPGLVGIYGQAMEKRQVIICEAG